MWHKILTKFRLNKNLKEDRSSEFSRFFRTASSKEKKKVFLDIAQKASEEQQKVFS